MEKTNPLFVILALISSGITTRLLQVYVDLPQNFWAVIVMFIFFFIYLKALNYSR